jgi:hypothetical protein
MFCNCEVRYIKAAPDGEGYIIYFAWHGGKRGAFKENIYQDLMWVHARKCVFLGAGSLGTTEILLRSKRMGLKMSDSVGTGMSGNGDILAFGYAGSLFSGVSSLNVEIAITRTLMSTLLGVHARRQSVPSGHVSPV